MSARRQHIKDKSKSAAKSADKGKPALVAQPHGGALLASGKPGNAGGSGRPPDEFKARLRELVTQADKAGHLEAVLSDPDHPQWLAALKFATEYGYGKPPQSVAISAEVPREVTTNVWRFGDRLVTF